MRPREVAPATANAKMRTTTTDRPKDNGFIEASHPDCNRDNFVMQSL
jgi:hypothetical protein